MYAEFSHRPVNSHAPPPPAASDDECSAQLGCSVGGICAACADDDNRAACESNAGTWLTPCQPMVDCDTFIGTLGLQPSAGCEWNVDDEVCLVKHTEACADIDSEGACTTAVGCSWVEEAFDCSGTATPCDELDESECALQEGCMAL